VHERSPFALTIAGAHGGTTSGATLTFIPTLTAAVTTPLVFIAGGSLKHTAAGNGIVLFPVSRRTAERAAENDL